MSGYLNQIIKGQRYNQAKDLAKGVMDRIPLIGGKLHGLAHDMGTAVTVQRMVFGNAGGLSGAGVGFTRNPSSGEPLPWVDFLFNAQGEDVVSGRRSAQGHDELAAVAPHVWEE